MQRKAPMKKTGVLLLILGAISLAMAGQEPGTIAKVRAETGRIEKALAGKLETDRRWKNNKPQVAKSLERADAALAAGRLYLGLEELNAGRSLFRTVEVVEEKASAVKDNPPGFEKEWQIASRDLLAVDRAARARDWSRKPAALRALAEAAQGTTRTLLVSSRAYAGATSPGSGLAYLGEAKATAEFSALCYSLPATRSAAPFPLRSVRPELDRLQERVNAAFVPPRSIELHDRFIRLNSTLKLAGDLDAAGLPAGALYQYLDAVQQLGSLDGPAPDEARQGGICEALASQAAMSKRSRRDDSIAELFLQRAEGLLAGADGAPPGPDDWKSIAAIVEQVLPEYRAVATGVVVPKERMAAASAVTVTLVRWPYT
jgi:hypothetical protein